MAKYRMEHQEPTAAGSGRTSERAAAPSRTQAKVKPKPKPFTAPFVVILLVILLVAVVTVLVSQQRSYREHLSRRSELLDELERVERESESLASQLKDVDSSEYAEQVAREELGMVRPGEIVFESPGSHRDVKDKDTETETVRLPEN